MNDYNYYDLPALTIPVAEHDGLINIKDLVNPIEVRIPIVGAYRTPQCLLFVYWPHTSVDSSSNYEPASDRALNVIDAGFSLSRGWNLQHLLSTHLLTIRCTCSISPHLNQAGPNSTWWNLAGPNRFLRPQPRRQV
ncbi:hypothetical protein TRP66_19300 [Pseudomonas sp. JDS28PS106]|uniref:hypothetical protein n=1 Tax=Pseudomonas sp. JDS28PS106 TaxID=2497235 RepID=UPI002FCFC163